MPVDLSPSGTELYLEPVVLIMVKLLPAHGAQVQDAVIRDQGPGVNAAFIPLHLTVHADFVSVVAVLLAAVADPLGIHEPGAGTPLLFAVASGWAAVLRVMLKHPAVQVHALGPFKGTLVHIACWHCLPACVKALLEAGADPRVSWLGYTPLQLVAQRKRPGAQLQRLLLAPRPCSAETERWVVTLLVQALQDWGSRSAGGNDAAGVRGEECSVQQQAVALARMACSPPAVYAVLQKRLQAWCLCMWTMH